MMISMNVFGEELEIHVGRKAANGPTILLFRNERNEPDMHGVGSSRCESAAERIAAVTHSRVRPTISAAGGDRVHDVRSALRGRVGHLRATAPHDSVPSSFFKRSLPCLSVVCL